MRPWERIKEITERVIAATRDTRDEVRDYLNSKIKKILARIDINAIRHDINVIRHKNLRLAFDKEDINKSFLIRSLRSAKADITRLRKITPKGDQVREEEIDIDYYLLHLKTIVNKCCDEGGTILDIASIYDSAQMINYIHSNKSLNELMKYCAGIILKNPRCQNKVREMWLTSLLIDTVSTREPIYMTKRDFSQLHELSKDERDAKREYGGGAEIRKENGKYVIRFIYSNIYQASRCVYEVHRGLLQTDAVILWHTHQNNETAQLSEGDVKNKVPLLLVAGTKEPEAILWTGTKVVKLKILE